jgi:hypothetical protein
MLYLLHRSKNDYERDKKGASIAGEGKGVEKIRGQQKIVYLLQFIPSTYETSFN